MTSDRDVRPFVRRMEIGDDEVDQPTWEEVRRAILDLPDQPDRDVLLEGGEDAVMVVCFAPPLGFYVVAREDGELEESVLVAEGADDRTVEVVLAGNLDDVLRRRLVDEASVVAAAEAFHLNGKRLRSLAWEAP